MNTDKMLLDAIHADPFDRTAWLALCDWLEEDDQLDRAELLRLQLRLIETLDAPDRPDWEARAQQPLAQGVCPCVPQLRLSLDRETALLASLIPAGSFWMGDDPPGLRITLTQPFYIGIYPVTQAQWLALMRLEPARFPGPDRPVEQVNYDDCWAFCKKLSEKSGRLVRLPSEAEWEYACRAGTTTRYCSGNEEADLERVAWSRGEHTHAVGQKQPNAWGLYDLHGNVWEWCRDADGSHPEEREFNPFHDRTGPARVCKGGSYGNPTWAGNRIGFMGGGRNDFIGCRVVIEWHQGK